MSDDIKKKLGIQDTHQQMYDELFAEMVARAVDNDPQMVASTFVALGLRLYRSALPKKDYERLLKTFFEMAKDIQPFQEGVIKETLH